MSRKTAGPTVSSRITAPDVDAGLVAVLLVGMVTPLLANRPGAWVDERVVLRLLEEWTAVELLTVLPFRQPHLPTWYLIPELAGPGAALLVSALSLPVTVYATFRLAGQFTGYRGQLAAATLVVLSPYLASQASWLRMYAPLTAAMTVGLWLAYERRYRASAAAMALGASLHAFGAFGPAWLGYRLVVTGAATRRRLGLAGLGLLPPALLVAAHATPTGFTVQSTGVGHAHVPSLLQVVMTPLGVLKGSMWTVWLEFLPALALLLVLVWWWPDRDLAVWVVAPLAAVSLASVVLHPVFTLKYFGFIAPAVAVGLVARAKPAWARSALLVLLTALYATGWLQWLAGVAIARRFMFT